MKVAVFGRYLRERNSNKFLEMMSLLKKEHYEVIFYQAFYEKIKNILPKDIEYKIFNSSKEILDVDFLFSIGGDGTMLDCVAYAYNGKVPIVGVNFGRVGFLTSVSIENFKNLLDQLSKKKYDCDVRNLIHIDVKGDVLDGPSYALNEFCIYKNDPSSMISIKVSIDDELLNIYWADGLIVSTPTGSTGYSLSCNGPIAFPNTDCMIITPIAAHNLNVRPIIAPLDCKINVEVKSSSDQVCCMLDSRKYFVSKEASFIVSKEISKVKIVRYKESNFLETIRKKLHWGNDLRNIIE